MLVCRLTYPTLWPVAVGAKLTLTVQVAPTARGEEETQLSVSEKSADADTLVMLRLALLLVLAKVKVCAPLVVPIPCVPNDSEVGVADIGALATKTGTALLGPPEYVAVTIALPTATALTNPLALTVTMAVLDEENDRNVDSVTSSVAPSEKVPDILR
jgi:hypothetical protein